MRCSVVLYSHKSTDHGLWTMNSFIMWFSVVSPVLLWWL